MPKTEEDEMYMQHVPYANVVGSIIYAMICTHQDLDYVISMVSIFMTYPGKEDW